LNSFRGCILKISELEKSDWLFQHRDGYDEKLIDLAAEMVIFRDIHPSDKFSPNVVVDSDGKMFNVCTSVLGCGDACMWLPSLVISFGVWCISRIFDIMLLEKQPVMRGEYSMVLNRLQVKFIFCLHLFFSFLKNRFQMLQFCLYLCIRKKWACNLVVAVPY